jgi:hypothetical protein
LQGLVQLTVVVGLPVADDAGIGDVRRHVDVVLHLLAVLQTQKVVHDALVEEEAEGEQDLLVTLGSAPEVRHEADDLAHALDVLVTARDEVIRVEKLPQHRRLPTRGARQLAVAEAEADGLTELELQPELLTAQVTGRIVVGMIRI